MVNRMKERKKNYYEKSLKQTIKQTNKQNVVQLTKNNADRLSITDSGRIYLTSHRAKFDIKTFYKRRISHWQQTWWNYIKLLVMALRKAWIYFSL